MAMPRRLFAYLAARLKVDDILLLLQVTLTASAVSALSLNQASASELPDYQWSVVNPASPWAPRAGLQVVESNDAFYLMGGRTPVDPIEVPVFGASVLWADVWKSDDQGATWEQILNSESPGHWPGRAYFQAERKRIEQEVRDSAYHIIDYQGATCFAVGLALVRIVGAILRGESSALTVATKLDGEFGLHNVCRSVPCLVSGRGVARIIARHLSEDEVAALSASAAALRGAIEQRHVASIAA